MQKNLLKIAIRVDANDQIGGGHFRRCFSLAEEIKARGHTTLFISTSLPMKLRQMLKTSGFNYKVLEPSTKTQKILKPESYSVYENWLELPKIQDAKGTREIVEKFRPNWVIFDNYALDFEWVTVVRKNLDRVPFLAIDDLDNRNLGADFLLDQTSLRKRKRKYKSVAFLEGPRFTLLTKNFRELRTQSILERSIRQSRNCIGKKFCILISVGMYDPKKIMPYLLRATAIIKDVHIDVAISSDSQTLSQIRKLAKVYANINLHLDKSDISFLMLKADLCIGATGMSTWERCCMGLPTLTIAIAQNQRNLTKELKKINAAKVITITQAKSKKNLYDTVSNLVNSPEILKKLSKNSKNLCDGLGAKRVMDFLEAKLRSVKITDSRKLLTWRNKSFVREMSLDKKTLSEKEHRKWMQKTQNGLKGIWLIYSEGNVEIGHCNSVFISKNEVFWSFYIGENSFSKGSGKRMLAFFLKQLFYEKGIKTINAKVLNQNFKSKLVHQHLGFSCINKSKEYSTFSLSRTKFECRFYKPYETKNYT